MSPVWEKVFVGIVFVVMVEEVSLQEFAKANNLFTVAVYKELAKKSNINFMVSPLSAETVLALAQLGAKDQTAQEIRTVLHLPEDQEKIKSDFKQVQTKLKSSEDFSLQTANKIYVKKDFDLDPDFQKTATETFDADVESVAFIPEAEAAKTINSWVEEKTDGKIHTLLSPESLNNRTRAILINALYFKGVWASRFDAYATLKKDFYKSAEEVVQVDTMRDHDYYKYQEVPDLEAKFLELPLQGDGVWLTIVLPNAKEGLAGLEAQMEKVLEVPKVEGFEYVNVSLPKFKFETEIDLKGILQSLGVTKAFKDDEADLSGIAGKKGDLVIDEVLQKTFIGLNEEGVEAAAASAVQIGVPLSGIIAINSPKEFIADHPFLFYIKVDDFILFTGRVVAPSY